MRQPNPIATITATERVYALDAMDKLMVFGTADRHVSLVDLTNPGVVKSVSWHCSCCTHHILTHTLVSPRNPLSNSKPESFVVSPRATATRLDPSRAESRSNTLKTRTRLKTFRLNVTGAIRRRRRRHRGVEAWVVGPWRPMCMRSMIFRLIKRTERFVRLEVMGV